MSMGKMSANLAENMEYLGDRLGVGTNFDVLYRVVEIGGKQACLYMIDGFCKDEVMQKLMQHFMGITEDKMPGDAHAMSKQLVPYGEVDLKDDWDEIEYAVMSGVVAMFLEGYDQCILIDARTYPARSVSEPEKDKVMRGSKDGFVETIVFNTALIRRRIRSPQLRMEMMKAGKSSRTDIVLCYMKDRADAAFLQKIRDRIANLQVDALTLNQESLAECLYQRKWYNPFPKFKYTERPDTAAAQVLEGNIIILVDNSPSAMITPTSFFDVAEEADDYYFPPVTGTYLRLSRMLIALLTYFLTPTFLLLMEYPQWIPKGFEFILLKDTVNIPLIWQFLILELAIDGLKLAAVNTPNMLSTPLSVLAALVLGEFSVTSGWFNAEPMLYMSFVCLKVHAHSQSDPDGAVWRMGIRSRHPDPDFEHCLQPHHQQSELSVSAAAFSRKTAGAPDFPDPSAGGKKIVFASPFWGRQTLGKRREKIGILLLILPPVCDKIGIHAAAGRRTEGGPLPV